MRVNLIEYQYEVAESLVFQAKCNFDTARANRAVRDACAIADALSVALRSLKALVDAVTLAASSNDASQIGLRRALLRKPMPR